MKVYNERRKCLKWLLSILLADAIHLFICLLWQALWKWLYWWSRHHLVQILLNLVPVSSTFWLVTFYCTIESKNNERIYVQGLLWSVLHTFIMSSFVFLRPFNQFLSCLYVLICRLCKSREKKCVILSCCDEGFRLFCFVLHMCHMNDLYAW